MLARIKAKVQIHVAFIVFADGSFVLEDPLRIKVRLAVGLIRPRELLMLVEAVGASDMLVGFEGCGVAGSTFMAAFVQTVTVVSVGGTSARQDICVLGRYLCASMAGVV